ncbi:MAG TPA: SMC family ATPase [Pseudonocardiaceae bacterium]|nr:SMC family ATPase [Pseudonocardiaceae bacterium]
MRLHRLDLTAFGPYPRHESVDFDALGQDGLFLLHGDTGAGKTTVLDAVAFALFGKVPGARGEAKRLRCDYAEPDTVTEVVLEFTVQGHRLRLVRSPDYERAKRNGGGVTSQRARASLTWVGAVPSGHTPDGLTRIDEVARTVQRLLGMNAEQFFQVVLLPQGEFARFLRSDTAEREQLLERLFGTERFADVERWFRDTRQARGHAVQELRQQVRELVARVSQAAGEEPPTDDGVAEDAPDSSWLAAVRARLAEDAVLTGKFDLQAREARERADADLQRQLELAQRVRRVRSASATLAELAESAGRRQSWTDELAAARRAVPVLVAYRTAKRAAEESAAAHRAEARTVGSVRALVGADADWSALLGAHGNDAASALRERAGVLRDEAGELRPLVAEAERQRLDDIRLAELVEREQSATDTSRQVTDLLSGIPMRATAAHTALDEANRATGQVAGLADRVAELEILNRDALRLPGVVQAAADARVAASDAVDQHQRARETLLDIRQRRLAGMAAELAGELRDDHPCAVCGSAEHPAPATATGHPVSDADERAATEAERAAAVRREHVADIATQAEHRLCALRDRLADRTADELATSLATASDELDAVRACGESLPARTATVVALERESEALRMRLTDAQRELAAAAADRTSLAAVVADRAERLALARGSFPEVRTRRAHLLDVVEALDACAEAKSTRLGAEARQSDFDSALAKAAEQAGFVGPTEAVEAARDDAAMAALAGQLAEADRRSAAAQAVLAEPELAGVDADTVVDVASAEVLATEAASEAEAAGVVFDAARRREQEVDRLAERLTRAWRQLAPVEAEFQRLVALTDVVNGRGQNARRMSLRSYVLAARLAEVAVAATRRLRQMSEGRYSFVHSSAAGPRGTRGGLGLDVLDDYSGQVRPAKTLSGGESFLASLSLALGLADVVAAETGGALLDTLFVDEGFGMLDADALDQVMDTLDELRAGGRVVGVVSHVEELRQRIPVRLRVRKARTGSTLELTAS